MKDLKLKESSQLLNQAYHEYVGDLDNKLKFAGVSKCYEVCFEYLWKFLKREADQSGLEVYSPRDAIKAAAQLGIISDPELWNGFLNARNLSVHDYLGINNRDFVKIIEGFLRELKTIVRD